MNLYTLPAATVADLPSEVGSLVYVAVKGERCECRNGLHEQGRCAAAWPVMPGDAQYPPSVLADLNGKTCEKCDGTGYHPHHRMEWHDIDCSDCAGTGRALLTIQHECKRNKVWCDQFDEACLADNCDDGTVTDPRRWTVDGLWPVTEYKKPLSVWRTPSGGWIHTPDDGGIGDAITVTGPPPSPGEFIVKLTAVTL